MKKNVLDILFGNPLRGKLMRFFYLNPDTLYTLHELSKKTSARPSALKSEISVLLKSEFLKSSSELRVVQPKTVKKKKKSSSVKKVKKAQIKKIKIGGYILNKLFPYFREMKQLFASAVPEARISLEKNIKKVGKINLVIISGVFIDSPSSNVDIIVVGDSVKAKKFDSMLRKYEKDLGKDLVYALMSTEEFNYRWGMHDRFLNDILEGPHEILFDKITPARKSEEEEY